MRKVATVGTSGEIGGHETRMLEDHSAVDLSFVEDCFGEAHLRPAGLEPSPMREAVLQGLEEPASRDFLIGRINVELATGFGELGSQPSGGALHTLEEAKGRLLGRYRREVFECDRIEVSARSNVAPGEGAQS